MPRRTTVILDDDIYEKLVRESIRRYGTTRALSRVLNELLRESFSGREELIKLIYSEKIAQASVEELNRFRRELSRRFIER
jgi:predicted CopG family antitoxin